MNFGENKKAIWSWCLYDWANSAFALTIMAAFFPGFFKGYWSSGVESAISTMRLGFGNAFAGLCVAVLSPVLGAIAGAGRAKKQFLTFFLCIGIIMTAGLFFIPKGEWLAAISVFIFARIGFNLANLFYDAFLVDVADFEQRDMVSSWGYGLGYLGCGILFIVNLLMYQNPAWFGLHDSSTAIRYIFLSAALWWLLFSIPILFFVHERTEKTYEKISSIIATGFQKLGKTAKTIGSDKNLLLFLIAYWCYIDGVHTVVMMCTDFGLSIGISFGTLMIALLCVQFVAFPSAIVFGLLSRRIGAKSVIMIAVAIYILITLGGAWILKTGTHFILFACLTGTVQGAIQALSRSFYSKMIPHDKSSEYFGFYNMVGRFAIILGPAIVALSNLIVHSIGLKSQIASRSGISSLAVLFIIGGLVLLQVKGNYKKNAG